MAIQYPFIAIRAVPNVTDENSFYLVMEDSSDMTSSPKFRISRRCFVPPFNSLLNLISSNHDNDRSSPESIRGVCQLAFSPVIRCLSDQLGRARVYN
jgi:hypothetical protein